MSTVIERLRKRRAYRKSIAGEAVVLRAMSNKEVEGLESLTDDKAIQGAVVGCCLLNEDESPVFTRAKDEDFQAFGNRVWAELDWPSDTMADVSTAAAKLSRGGNIEELVKN